MGQHGSDNRHWVSPHGAVAAKGVKSFELGEAQVGLFSKKSVDALGDVKGVSNKEQLVLRYGDSNLRKNPSTIPFTLGHVKKVTVGLPKVAEWKTDYVRVGWDGLNDETSLKFYKGDAWSLQVTVGGMPVTLLNSSDKYTFEIPVTMEGPKYGLCLQEEDLCDLLPCQDKTIEMVNQLNKSKFPSGQLFSEYFEAYPIFSRVSNPQARDTKEYTQYCLEFCGFGDANELAKVSAQYPGKKVVKDAETGKFVMMSADGKPKAYERTLDAVLKGCKDCPDGYQKIEGGYVYAVKIEDNGQDLTSTVQGINNAVAGSAKKTGQDMGVGYYVVATSQKLTDEQIKAFAEKSSSTKTSSAGGHTHTLQGGTGTIDAAPGHTHTITGLSAPAAEVMFVGTTAETCKNDAKTTHEWVACGTCKTFKAKYRIMVPDDCGGAALKDLQARYPNLNVTQVKRQNCLGIYEGTVETDFSCSTGCNDAIVQQVFNSDRPEPYSFNSHWYPVTETKDATGVSCGIEIKAKPFLINPSECFDDKLPFVATSINILGVSGGYQDDFSYGARSRDLVNVTTLETAQDVDNLGGNLKGFERRGNFYFTGQPYDGSSLGRYFRGTQSLLDNMTRYVDITLTVNSMIPQSMNMATPKAMTYHVYVPFGRHTALEELYLSIAAKADAEVEYI